MVQRKGYNFGYLLSSTVKVLVFYCSCPRYDSPAHGSEGEEYRLGSIFARGNGRPKPEDEEGRVDSVAHGRKQETDPQDHRAARRLWG